MSFFSKKETKFFIYRYFKLNLKKGALERLESKTLGISYLLWRKNQISFTSSLNNVLKKNSPYINFKKVKLRGVLTKIPFFVQSKKRSSLALNWVPNNFENLIKEDPFKARKKIIHEAANQHKVFAYKRWF